MDDHQIESGRGQPCVAVSEDLVARCREVLSWHKTGVCRQDGELADLAETLVHFDEADRMRQAETQTAKEAMSLLATLSPGRYSAAEQMVASGVASPLTEKQVEEQTLLNIQTELMHDGLLDDDIGRENAAAVSRMLGAKIARLRSGGSATAHTLPGNAKDSRSEGR